MPSFLSSASCGFANSYVQSLARLRHSWKVSDEGWNDDDNDDDNEGNHDDGDRNDDDHVLLAKSIFLRSQRPCTYVSQSRSP